MNRVVMEARSRGIFIDDASSLVDVAPNADDLEGIFNEAKNDGVEFIYFAHPDEETTLHGIFLIDCSYINEFPFSRCN